jgi:hypothetical protein
MQDLIFRFLKSSGVDPVYFITCIVDVIAIFLWVRLKRGLSDLQRSLYRAIILVAIVLTAGALCKFFGLIMDWKELESIWSS